MGLFRSLLYSALLNRVLRGGRPPVDPRRYGPRYGTGPRRGVYGPGYGLGYGPRRPPARGGFRFAGPIPTYSGTTRRGNRVQVGGCCLPIPLMVLVTGALAGLVRRRSAPGA